MINAIYAPGVVFLQCFSNKILIYLKYFVSLKSHSELATQRWICNTAVPLNIFGNVMFNGSIADFCLIIIIIVQAQRVLMYIYTFHRGHSDDTITCITKMVHM